jgi:molecular chaperone GrpE
MENFEVNESPQTGSAPQEPKKDQPTANGNGQEAAAPEARIAELEKNLAETEAKLTEEKNKYLYLYADFDNFKKRAVKERSDLMKFGWENIARDLLSVVDNLERAVEAMPATVDANLRTGIEMILSQFRSTLERQGALPITSDGSAFNPEIHEAMGQEPSDKPQGTITKTLVKGYTLNGRLLRPARVVVSTGQAPTA